MSRLLPDIPAPPGDRVGFGRIAPPLHRALKRLEEAFGVPFAVFDGTTGRLLHSHQGVPAADWQAQGELCRAVEARRMHSVAVILGIHGGSIDLYRQQRSLLEEVIRTLISSIDAKDPSTSGHSDRVARIAVRLAQHLGCDGETIDAIYLSGLLHDIGKIGVADSVLRKPGRLTAQEYEHIKTHVTVGHQILRGLAKLEEVLPVVLHHHEWWDGSGYPHRLQGEEIPLPARIVAVADAYDAMASNRPYRKGLPPERIEEAFRSGSGSQWDPRVVDALLEIKGELRSTVSRD